MNQSIVVPSALPVQSMSRRSDLFPGYYCAKSGLGLRNWKGDPIFIGGFSFGDQSGYAQMVATCEVYERFYALYDAQSERLRKSSFLPCYVWGNQRIRQQVHAAKVLIGSAPGMSSAGNDASGLGFHCRRADAEQHAVFELAERHLLARIWYGDAKVTPVTRPVCVTSDWRLTYFTVAMRPHIPFSLAVLWSPSEPLWIAGSSICTTMREAQSKAWREAQMLADTIMHRDVGPCGNSHTRERLFALRGATAIVMQRHFAMKNVRRKNALAMDIDALTEPWSIVRRVFGNVPVYCVPLHESSNAYVIRALCDSAWKLRTLRLQRSATDTIPRDPFC